MKTLIAPLIGLAAGLLTASSLSAMQSPVPSFQPVSSPDRPDVVQVAMGSNPSTTRMPSSSISVSAGSRSSASESRSGSGLCRPPNRIPGQWANCSPYSADHD